MLGRTFTLLSAAFLVSAAALAALMPYGMSLSRGVSMLNGAVEPWLRAHSPVWLQVWVEVPMLSRPLWLLPTVLGVVCAGVAASATLRAASPTRRRRS